MGLIQLGFSIFGGIIALSMKKRLPLRTHSASWDVEAGGSEVPMAVMTNPSRVEVKDYPTPTLTPIWTSNRPKWRRRGEPETAVQLQCPQPAL